MGGIGGVVIIITHLRHDILLFIQVMDAQLTQVWHKGSGVISRTHGVDSHSAKLKVDALEVDPQ